ncbi:hypothetical protein GC197_13925 [bacterium]|nr:hypothetical protein [bacterium]
MSPILIAILILLFGFALLFLEVLLPTAGVLGFFGVVALVSAVVYGFLKCDLGVATGLLVLTVILVPFVLSLAVEIWPRTPIGKMILLDTKVDDGSSGQAESPVHLVGRQGIAKSDLLPSGIAEIDGKRWDVVAVGPVVDRGELIEVVEVEGNRVFVTRIDESDETPEIVEDDRETESLTSRNDEIFEDDPFA